MRWLLLLITLSILLTGCSQSTYRIRSNELQRLASTPVEQRSQSVRVTQDLFSRNPPPPMPAPPPALVRSPQDAVEIIATTSRIARASKRQSHVARRPPSRSSSDSSDSSSSAGTAAIIAVAIVAAVAAGVTVALALTEGTRYDGWVQLEPTHPIHLLRGREHLVVPLSSLEPHFAAWAQEGFMNSDEGSVYRLQRAPLDRQGFVYHFELGAGDLYNSQDDSRWGFLTNIAIGGFPIHQLGILAKVSLGVGSQGDWMFNGRYGLEVQGYFVSVQRFHFGVYAEVGYGNGSTGTESDGGVIYGGGGLIEVDITTRLALSLRGGVTVLSRDEQIVLPVAMIGLATY